MLYLENWTIAALATIFAVIDGAPRNTDTVITTQKSEAYNKSGAGNPHTHTDIHKHRQDSYSLNNHDFLPADDNMMEDSVSFAINKDQKLLRPKRWVIHRREYDRVMAVSTQAPTHSVRHGNKKRHRQRRPWNYNWDYSPYGGGVFGRKKRDVTQYDFDYLLMVTNHM